MISLVTGTYNRLEQLRNMIESARAAAAAGLLSEVVVVDGGSTDGTLAWCREQFDVHLIEHGGLHGAIKAFCDGAKAARGDYVLMANDDIVFAPDSITRAAVYLETHPTCGAVAFADNRPAPGYGDGYKVQLMDARNADDTVGMNVPYAQVGLFRRWLGDLCGWWGADDHVMQHAHTYGGDNYLSARIWEYGYRVDPVDGCRVDDLVHDDGLRERNLKREQKSSGTYYRRFPGGVYVGWREMPDNPQQEQMRILYAPLYEPGYGHYKTGLRDALSEVGQVWEYDYMADKGASLVKRVATWQPHLLLTQVHSASDLPHDVICAAREQAPSMVVTNWNGDVYPDGLISDAMLAWLRGVDVQLTVNADVLDTYKAEGISAAYWQIGFEPVDEGDLPDVPAHDVVFLGNCYSDKRRALGAALRRLNGVDVGIYGRGWPADIGADGECLYDFAKGRALYRNAKLAIGDNQWGDEGFVSNRLFEALAAGGAMLLHQTVPGLHELTGLQDGTHYVSWRTPKDLRNAISIWTARGADDKRATIAQCGADFARTHHSFAARVRELFEGILPEAVA